MKVIGISNHGSETMADHLVVEGLTEDEARAKATELNQGADNFTPRWFVVKPDDYVLWRGMEEFMTSPAIVREALEPKAIAASVLQSACETDPADPKHPDTITISCDDLETIARAALAALDATPGEGFQAGAEAMREVCVKAAAEQRCERGTPWDLACVAIIDAIRALPLPAAPLSGEVGE